MEVVGFDAGKTFAKGRVTSTAMRGSAVPIDELFKF